MKSVGSVGKLEAFLNAFGLSFKGIEKDNSQSVQREEVIGEIYNKQKKSVGEVTAFINTHTNPNSEIVTITAKIGECVLRANYSTYTEIGYNEPRTRIVYGIENAASKDSDVISLNGEVSIDPHYGYCTMNGKFRNYRVDLDFHKNKFFDSEVRRYNDFCEQIQMDFTVSKGVSMFHMLKSGKKEETYKHIRTTMESDKNGQLSIKASREVINENNLTHSNEYSIPVAVDMSTESQVMIQKGKLMRQYDPFIIQGIESLRRLLTIDNVSLVDGFINLCYDRCSDRTIGILFGVERDHSFYQEGSNVNVDTTTSEGAKRKSYHTEEN